MNRQAPRESAPQGDVLDVTLRGLCGYAMKRAFLGIQADLNRVLAPLGLRMMTFSALVVIVDNPGLRQSRLAESLAVEPPNLVGLVDELARAGWVDRNPAPDDRRALALVATQAGQALANRALDVVRAHEARLTRDLGDADLRALLNMLNAVESAANEETPDG